MQVFGGMGMTRVGGWVFASLLSLCPSEQAAHCLLSRFYYYLAPEITSSWRPSGDGQALLVPNPGGAGGRAGGRRSVLPLLLVLKAGCVASCLSREHIPPRDPSMSGFAPVEVTFLAEGLRSTPDLCASPTPVPGSLATLGQVGSSPLVAPPSPGAQASLSCGAPARVPEPGPLP